MKPEPVKIYPKKYLGQHYLIDENISRNIVTAFNISEGDNLIEIGPGQGALTKYILEKSKNLTVIEIDKNNCALLEKKFPGLNIIYADFLKYDFSQQSGTNLKYRVIGNIPYNITTEIIFRLIDYRNVISDAQIMIQKEVAQRLAAKPNSKEYGIPSVFVQVFSKPKLLFKVSKNCFYPRPKVDSRIIHFDFSYSIENKIKDIVFFKKFVKAAFSTRRKTLKNSLSSLGLDLSTADFDFTRRAENLSIDEFINLSNTLNTNKPGTN